MVIYPVRFFGERKRKTKTLRRRGEDGEVFVLVNEVHPDFVHFFGTYTLEVDNILAIHPLRC